MQALYDACDESPADQHNYESYRVLEDTDCVVIQSQGKAKAALYGLLAPRSFYLDGATLRTYWCKRLIWTHAGAMQLLHGVPTSAILGPSWLILGGRPTLSGDPSPGVARAVLAEVLDNEAQLSHVQLFTKMHDALPAFGNIGTSPVQCTGTEVECQNVPGAR